MSPRYRWIKLYTIAYVISISVVIAVMVAMNYNTPAKDRQPIGILNILGGVALFAGLYLVCFLIVGICFAIIQFSVRSELDQNKEQQAIADAVKNHNDYPGVTVFPDYSAPSDGPGRYRIQGVSRTTKQDATIDLHADSAANAKVKAELEDIVVTSVEKI